jgi:hypothetical protein
VMDGRVKPGNDESFVSRTRCGILHAAPQSRDRNEHRRLVRSRFCEAPLRKSYALHRARDTIHMTSAGKTKPPTCFREWAAVSPSGEGGACA